MPLGGWPGGEKEARGPGLCGPGGSVKEWDDLSTGSDELAASCTAWPDGWTSVGPGPDDCLGRGALP